MKSGVPVGDPPAGGGQGGGVAGAPSCVEDFLTYLAVERVASGHTLWSYRTDLADCQAFLACRRLPDLVDADTRALRAYLAELHARGLARTSVARRLAALRSFYRYDTNRAHGVQATAASADPADFSQYQAGLVLEWSGNLWNDSRRADSGAEGAR